MTIADMTQSEFEAKATTFLRDFADAAGVQEKEVMCRYQHNLATSTGRRLAEAHGIVVSCAVAAADYEMAEELKKTAFANEFDLMFGDKLKTDLQVSAVKTQGVEVVPISSKRPTAVPTQSPTASPTTQDGLAAEPAPSIVVTRSSVGCVAGHCD
jgi:hypothetical protein